MEEWEYRQMKEKKETNLKKEVYYEEERGCSIEAEGLYGMEGQRR
jgi:hypothetical protein